MKPIASYYVSNPFAARGSYASSSDSHGSAGHHTGVDYAASTGRLIRSSTPGVVVISEYNSTMGNWVGVYYAKKNVTITYWHMNKRAVRVGQRVHRGTVLGRVGSTGNSTGPHCHIQANYGRGFYYSGHINPSKLIGGRTWAQVKRDRKRKRIRARRRRR